MVDAIDQAFDETESVDAAREARELASRTAAAQIEHDETTVTIFDPEHDSLVYGQFSDIKFGPRGGFEPNVWRGPRDHPLIPQMMLDHPKMFEVGLPEKVFVCPVDNTQFKSIQAFHGHTAKAHRASVVKQ